VAVQVENHKTREREARRAASAQGVLAQGRHACRAQRERVPKRQERPRAGQVFNGHGTAETQIRTKEGTGCARR